MKEIKTEDKKNFNRFNNSNVVDLAALFMKVRSLWYVCVIGLLIGATSGALYYGIISTPKYESTSMVYLRSSNKKISLESLQLSTSLTQDYQLIFTSRPNLQQVINELHLNYTVDQLKDMISIENPTETRILQITTTSKNAKEARNITNALMRAGMSDIREIDSQEPYVVEKGIVNSERVGFSLLKTTILCSLVGLIISFLIISIKFIYNDSFVSSDDVENTLDMPVLAVIAEDESLAYAKLEATSSRRRKHHGKKISK